MSVVIAREDLYNAKLKALQKDGKSNFHIVCDFDSTITKPKHNKNLVNSSFERIREGSFFPPGYNQEGKELFEEYYHYQNDPDLSLEVRSAKMQEWWRKELELLVKHGFAKSMVDQAVALNDTEPREGLKDLIDWAKANNIPVLVFSSGLSEYVHAWFKKFEIDDSAVHVIANSMKFDDSGKAVGFSEPIIHPFNQFELHAAHQSYVSDLKRRKNVILLGHTVSDLGMPTGLEHKTTLAIGFWTEDWDVGYNFKRNFDLVINSDDDMHDAVNLIKSI